MQISILREDNEAVITVSVPGDPRSPYIARDDHPNFKTMVAALLSGEVEDLPALFDVAESMKIHFQRLSERVTVQDGEIRFDGVTVDSTLSQQILDVIQEGATDASYKGLVAFMHNIYDNPDRPTSTRIFDWLKAQDGLTITDEGKIVGYKYVREDSQYGYRSSASGKEPCLVTFADGTAETFTGHIPNPVGGTVEMPRNLVNANASQTCSVGLHVGAWNYVSGHGTILEVHVNPRDVVAVPTDYNGEKVRVCRYNVVGKVAAKYGQAVKATADEAPRERGSATAPTTREDLDLALAPLRKPSRFAVGDQLKGFGAGIGPVTVDAVLGGENYKLRFNDNSTGNFDLGEGSYWPGVAKVSAAPTRSTQARAAGGSGGAHGKGGATSQAAKGRGRNPEQDSKGRFSAGRATTSQRDSSGRFVR